MQERNKKIGVPRLNYEREPRLETQIRKVPRQVNMTTNYVTKRKSYRNINDNTTRGNKPERTGDNKNII